MGIHIRCFAIEETQHYPESFQLKAGHIYGIYLYDSSQVAHLCEAAGSYYCRPIGFMTERYLNDEDETAIAEAQCDCEEIYLHCSQVEHLPNIEFLSFDFNLEDFSGYTEEQCWDEATETFCQNSGYYQALLQRIIWQK